MSEPIYLQDYKVESEQGNVNYSVVGALPNEMPGVETKQYTWNFVSHMVLDKCSRLIRIKYDFKDTEFQKEITFEDKLTGTVQLGSKVYNAGDIMSYKYDIELLEMEVTILFPVDEKICGKDLSWNIFINDKFDNCGAYPTNPINIDTNGGSNDVSNWTFEFEGLSTGETLINANPSCSNVDTNTTYAIIKGTINITKLNYGSYNFDVTNFPLSYKDGFIDYPVFLAPITVNPPSNISCSNLTANASWILEDGTKITCGPAVTE